MARHNPTRKKEKRNRKKGKRKKEGKIEGGPEWYGPEREAHLSEPNACGKSLRVSLSGITKGT